MRQILHTMKKKCILTALFLAITTCAISHDFSSYNELTTLDKHLALRQVIESAKRVKIDSLYNQAALSNAPYEIYRSLYEEYRSYNYDTALLYVDFMEREATPAQLPEVELCRAFVYLSGGLFKEASDILATWCERHSAIHDSDLLLRYYILYTRLLWDMSDHAGGNIGAQYNREGIEMNSMIIQYLSEQDTAYRWYALAMTDLREGNYARSIERCKASLAATQPSVHDQAITASTLAHLYRQTGDKEAALHYYIEAAICDIHSSTYETVAMRNIAEILFEAGETDRADRYIHIAMQDAQRYHARHRQVSIAQSLPIIEEKMLSRIRVQQYVALGLLIFVGILLLIGIGGIILLIRRNRALQSARETISRMNVSLTEANKLKEELLGTLLASRSQFIASVQRYQQDVRQNAANRRWSELTTIPKAADARQQRLVLDRQIDTIFLSLYPTFVEDFNRLLRPEEQIVLKKDELLNAQLRIFALIRLGISHNEIIAQILNYSVNTVYSYKTRVIAASDLSPEAFYTALMHIPSFSH